MTGLHRHTPDFWGFFRIFVPVKLVEDAISQLNSNDVFTIPHLFSLVSCLFQSRIKIRGTADVFTIFNAVFSVVVVKFTGFLLVASIHDTAFMDEVSKPVIAFPIRANCI